MAQQPADVAAHVPPQPPRTMVIEGRQKNFHDYLHHG